MKSIITLLLLLLCLVGSAQFKTDFKATGKHKYLLGEPKRTKAQIKARREQVENYSKFKDIREEYKHQTPQAGGSFFSLDGKETKNQGWFIYGYQTERQAKIRQTRRFTPQTVAYFLTPTFRFDFTPFLNRPLFPLHGIVPSERLQGNLGGRAMDSGGKLSRFLEFCLLFFDEKGGAQRLERKDVMTIS